MDGNIHTHFQGKSLPFFRPEMAVYVQIAFDAAHRGFLGDEIGTIEPQYGLLGFQLVLQCIQHLFQFKRPDGPHLFQAFHEPAHVGTPLFPGQIHSQAYRGHRGLGAFFPIGQHDGPAQIPDAHMFQGYIPLVFLGLYVFQHTSPLYTMPLVFVSHTWTSYRA